MKQQSKIYINFTFILPAFAHKTRDFTFILTYGWWCPDIVKSSTIFPVCNGLLTAQVFRKCSYHMESNNISMPAIHIKLNKRNLTLLKIGNRSRK